MADSIRQTRWDGRIEQMCEHGIGHTVSVKYVKYRNAEGKVDAVWWVHGCDGCCKEYTRDE